jgi:hypothetical protein
MGLRRRSEKNVLLACCRDKNGFVESLVTAHFAAKLSKFMSDQQSLTGSARQPEFRQKRQPNHAIARSTPEITVSFESTPVAAGDFCLHLPQLLRLSDRQRFEHQLARRPG